jgi:hypothetical protein
MNPTGLGSTGGQAADAGPSWRSYPDPVVARRSGPEEVSARVGNLALGTAALAGVAAPLGSAVDGERAASMAAAVSAAGAGAAASGGAGRSTAALASWAASLAAGSASGKAAEVWPPVPTTVPIWHLSKGRRIHCSLSRGEVKILILIQSQQSP